MCGDGGVGVMVLCSGGVLTCWRGDVVRAVTLCACVVWCGCREQPWRRGHGGTGAGVGQAGVADIAEPAKYVGCHSV